MTVREKHDYRAMLEDLQAHPGEERVVWTRPLTNATARQASAVASTLKYWIKLPHRGPNDRVECHYVKCDPVHTGEGDAFSRTDTGEATVVGRWDPTLDAAADDLAAWLLEQIADDERDVKASPSEWDHWMIKPSRIASRIKRVLAECETKRRIIEAIVPRIDSMDDQITGEWGGVNEGVGEDLLRLLALPYADRPGYRESWRP